MVEELRNKRISEKTGLGRKLTIDRGGRSHSQMQYHKPTKLWIPHRMRLYVYWYKMLQIAEQDTKRTVNWKKYRGWGGTNKVLGTPFNVWWEDTGRELVGYKKNEKEKIKFELITTRPKVESIRTAFLVYQRRHLPSYKHIAKEVQQYEDLNRIGVKKFKDATDDEIMNSGVYETDNYEIKNQKNVSTTRRRKLSAKFIKEEFGGFEEDVKNIKLDSHRKELKDRENFRLRKAVVLGSVGYYMRVAEDLLDGICECKYPYTPKLRERITHNVGGGRRKSKKEKFTIDDYIDEQIENAKNEELEILMKREKNHMDGKYKFGGHNYKKASEYNESLLTEEEYNKKHYYGHTKEEYNEIMKHAKLMDN